MNRRAFIIIMTIFNVIYLFLLCENANKTGFRCIKGPQIRVHFWGTLRPECSPASVRKAVQ